MGRSCKVEYEDVARACIAILHEGSNITFNKVYERLGKHGGGKEVHEYIKKFNQKTAQDLRGELPPEDPEDAMMADVIKKAILAAKKIAEGSAQRRLQSERDELKEERNRIEHSAQSALSEADRLKRESTQLRAESVIQAERIKELQETIKTERERISRLEASLVVTNEQLSRLMEKVIAPHA